MPVSSPARAMLCVAALLLGFSADAGDVPPDPAVAHANATRAGPIGYRQGWFGEGDNRLHYVEAGTGPLVILVHGFPSFWYSWFDQMEVLKDRYRVVAIDALGAGLSARPAGLEAYRVDALAAGIDALARSLSLNAGDPPDSRFVLIGHDWGAALAFAFAQARPERLHAVVGLNAPPYNQFLDLLQESPDQQARSDYMQAFRKLAPGSADEALARRVWQQSYAELSATGRLLGAEMALFGEALSRPGALNGGMNWYRANIPALEDLARQPRWPAGGTRLTLPAMLIWGGRDTAFTDEAVARTAAISDQLSIVRLPATGHWAGIETPTAVNTALVDFLAKLRSTAGTR